MTRRGLLALALAGLFAGAGAQPKARVIKIAARKFTYTPNLVTLKRGEPVVLEFTTADVFMGFSAPELKLRADIVPGQVARVPFTPDKAGSYDFLCDIFCGEGHEKMTGRIRVT